MKDISKKIKTLRIARAEGILKVDPKTILLIKEGKVPKGNPLEVSKIAAIQAAKNTAQIIPYCHNLSIDHLDINFELNENTICVTTTVKAIHKTGVEMEALTSCSVAILTLYDMLKMIDETMEISSIKLAKKKGGKSDFKQYFKTPPKAAVLVMSDSVTSGKKSDESGRLIVNKLKSEYIDVVDYKIIPDDFEEIKNYLKKYADSMKVDMVLTTGGTGFSPRDITPEAMKEIIEREIPGIPEALRAFGQERTPFSMLSRGKAGLRGKTLIINLPGSKGGVEDSLDSLFPAILHSLKTIQGFDHDVKKERVEIK